jgi:hypothetical protein
MWASSRQYRREKSNRSEFTRIDRCFVIPTNARDNRVGTRTNQPKSSCADLIRASTPLFRALEGMDGGGKPGQDEPRADFFAYIELLG